MSIEQTSVSNPVVRENEIGSKRSAWSETQGSATGSKDGQLSSFWDKAFLGAQKLFGLETATRNDLNKNEDSLREEEEYHKRTENRFENRRLDAAPGFGNSGFSRISASIRRDGSPELPKMAPVQHLSEKESANLPHVQENRDDERVENSGRESDEPWDRIEEPDEDSESVGVEAKTADFSPISPQGFANITSNNLGNIEQVIDGQTLKGEEYFIGINSAKQDLNMSTNLATHSLEEPATKGQSPVEAIEEVSFGGIRRLPSEGDGLLKGVSGGPEGSKSERERSAIVEAGKATDGKKAVLARNSSSVREANSISADSLTIDADKVKQNIAAIFDNAKAANLSKSGPALSGGTTQAAQSANVVSSTETPVEKEGGSDIEAKSPEVSKSTNSKNQTTHSARQDVVKPINSAASSVGSVHSEPIRSRGREIPSVGSAARITENALNSGKPGILNQSAPVSSGPVSTGLNAGSGESQVSNQLKGSFEKVVAKQEVESAQKASVSAKSTGTSAKGEGVQGIQLNGSDPSGSSKSSFAAKAQTVSYTTKSTEETKEIYTALSKSVDRLVGSKSDSVSIRINFDQGGSLALRVSMDSGQVNTSMQTDLPGLENLIKSSWSEFAHEQNLKGVKLNAPQFANGESESSKNDQFMNFDQKGGQSKGETSSESRPNGSRRPNTSSRHQAGNTSSDSAESSSEDLKTEQEFKTYA